VVNAAADARVANAPRPNARVANARVANAPRPDASADASADAR